MKSVAVLVDGAFLRKRLQYILRRWPTCPEILDYCGRCIKAQEEELFRIYFYDSPPYNGVETNPLNQQSTDFSATPLARHVSRVHADLSTSNNVAFRSGRLKFSGWRVDPNVIRTTATSLAPLQPGSLLPDIKQKEVDMKIGLDVAWLSMRKIVQRLILVTGDSDFCPAMKFARREGMQVIIATDNNQVSMELRRHADEVRRVVYP